MAAVVNALKLKLLINKTAHRVLFAEASKPVIDFLFNLLALPLATVVKLLSDGDFSGSLKNLHGSVQNLDAVYLLPNQTKDALLNPTVCPSGSLAPLSLPATIETNPKPTKFYQCSNSYCRDSVTNDPNEICSRCGNRMSSETKYVGTKSEESKEKEGGYVKEGITYMVMDDLTVKPMSIISSISLLKELIGVDLSCLEEKDVDLNSDQGLRLLRATLESKTVLTDVFLGPMPAADRDDDGVDKIRILNSEQLIKMMNNHVVN